MTSPHPQAPHEEQEKNRQESKVTDMDRMTRKWICTALLSALPGALVAAPINMHIVSNAGWKSGDAWVKGWEKPGFDDSLWGQAREHYPTPGWTPGDLIAKTKATTMWHDPKSISNGTSGPNQAFFRTTFNIDDGGAQKTRLYGTAIAYVDDDFKFYVNGRRVYSDKSDGGADIRHDIDFNQYLVRGTNTFAIHAVDGKWGSPYDRDYEMVLFDATLRSVRVGEPGSLGLAAIGLVGLLVARRHIRAAESRG